MTKHFKTNNVIVRKFNMKDVNQVRTNLSTTEEKSIEEAKMIVKSAINEYYTDEPTWAIEDKQKKNLVGVIRVTNYCPKNKICNITWTMSYKYWDDKFMKDALTQIFKFLFTKRKIELIECSYYEQDKKASIILDSIGMTREASLRDRRINEKTHQKENFVIYSINKQEFLQTQEMVETEYKIKGYLKRKNLYVGT